MTNQDNANNTNEDSSMARNIVLLPSLEKLLELNETLVGLYGLTNEPALLDRIDSAMELAEELLVEWQALNLGGVNNTRALAEVRRRIEILKGVETRLAEVEKCQSF